MQFVFGQLCRTALCVGLALVLAPARAAGCGHIAADTRDFWFVAQMRAAAQTEFSTAEVAKDSFDLTKSLTRLRAAEALLRAVVRIADADEDRLALASTLASEGAILVFYSERVCGRLLLMEGLMLVRPVALARGTTRARFVLATTQFHLATEAALSGRVGTAAEYLRLGASSLKELAIRDDRVGKLQAADLAVASAIAQNYERYDEALANLLQGFAELRERIKASPTVFTRVELAVVQAQLAAAQAHAGDRAASRASIAEAEAMVRSLYDRDGTIDDALQLAYVLLNRAAIENVEGDGVAVEATVGAIRALLRQTAKSHSKFGWFLLAGVEELQGHLEEGRHNGAAALRAFVRGVLVARFLFDDDPDPANREMLCRMLLGTLAAKLTKDRDGEAGEDLHALEELINVASLEDPAGDLRLILATAYNELGASRAKAEDWEAVLALESRSLVMARKGIAGRPDRAQFVMNALGWIGDAKVGLGDISGARAAYEEFMAIAARATGPSDSAYVKRLRGRIEARLARVKGK